MKPTEGMYQTEIRYLRVKVSSLETTNIEGVDSVHVLEDRTVYTAKARYILSFRGLSPWYGTARKLQELGRACINSGSNRIAANNPQRRGSRERVQAVGPTHSRGVAEVMLSEPRSGTRRGWQYYVKIKGDIIGFHRGVGK